MLRTTLYCESSQAAALALPRARTATVEGGGRTAVAGGGGEDKGEKAGFHLLTR